MSSYGAAGGPSSSFVNLDYADKKSGGINFHAQSVGLLAFPPFILFTIMDLTFAFLSGTYPFLCFVLASACIAFATLFYVIGKGHAKGPIYMFLSVLCFIATASGIMAGLSVQSRFYGNYWNYKNRPVYTDVMATDPAAARSDAGIINFANNAIVDTMRSGYILNSKGRKFCVAPILDETQQTRAEYWAVGMECCEGRISFYCDNAQDINAKTGAVVFNLDSYLVNDPYNKYMDAVRQAAARNQLLLPKDPVLVRWVKDSGTVTDGLWSDGSFHLFLGILLYGIASSVIGVALHAASSRGR